MSIIRAAVLFSEILCLWLNRNQFFDYLAKPIITRITVSLLLENVIIRAAVLLAKPIITRNFVSLLLENVIIRAAVLFS